MENLIKVKGSTILSFSNICINLEFMAEPELYSVIKKIKNPNNWYPFSILTNLFELIEKKYSDPSVFFEQIGEETMRLWFEKGDGRKVINKAVDFLRYQSGSKGYWSMVKGPENEIGKFVLKELDEENGKAVLVDTSPFNPYFIKGIITGGMRSGGDIKSVNVTFSEEDRTFNVVFR